MLKLRERNPNRPKITTTVTWNFVSSLLTITLCLQNRPRVHVEGDLSFDVSVTCAVVGVVLCFCYALYVNMIVVVWSSLPDLVCTIKRLWSPADNAVHASKIISSATKRIWGIILVLRSVVRTELHGDPEGAVLTFLQRDSCCQITKIMPHWRLHLLLIQSFWI